MHTEGPEDRQAKASVAQVARHAAELERALAALRRAIDDNDEPRRTAACERLRRAREALQADGRDLAAEQVAEPPAEQVRERSAVETAAIDAEHDEFAVAVAEVLSPQALRRLERDQAAQRKLRAATARASRRRAREEADAHPEGLRGAVRDAVNADPAGVARWAADSVRVDECEARQRRASKRLRRVVRHRLWPRRCMTPRAARREARPRGRRAGASSRTSSADPPPPPSGEPERSSPPRPRAGRLLHRRGAVAASLRLPALLQAEDGGGA